ncbi:branched-chain amino acid ABC transporter permease [Desulforhopalus singaporensis]|uniref:Branched-chain amino acid transport system permease protein n=1 Tax=Desulforhopalus singaporensis TaxID=91360 RepID=A0A1H0U2Y3_9BACT|nr:branched-chain amino acid ABC transporter permease [Desulforhopalus singaporensis]SDP60524.1 branched-chain amino acid transport system permease protein [Desulforhopalus singaporensis]
MNNSTQTLNPFDKLLDLTCFTPLGLLSLLVLAILPMVPPFNQEYLIRWLISAAFIASMAIAFDFTAGLINIVNFGYCAIMGLGAYTSAILVERLGLSPWLGMLAGGLAAAGMGLMIGMITLRLRGIFAACLAWFFGLALMGLATKLVWLTRGPMGMRVDRLFDTPSNVPFYYLLLAMMVIIYITCKWVTRTHMGVAFMAIGQNMEAARTSGIDPVFYRVSNFVLSCAIGGVLGGFYAHYYGILTPDIMHTSKTVEVLAVAYIGGRGSLWGGAAIAFPFIFAMELIRSSLSDLPGINLVLYGLLLIMVMIYYPGGFAQFFNTYFRQTGNKMASYLFNGVAADTK